MNHISTANIFIAYLFSPSNLVVRTFLNLISLCTVPESVTSEITETSNNIKFYAARLMVGRRLFHALGILHKS